MRLQIKAATLLLASFCLCACPAQSAPVESVEVVIDAADADADASDAADGRDADAGFEEPDAERDSDVAATPIAFDESLWEKPNPCGGAVSFADDDRDFEMPDRPPENEPVIRRRDFLHRYGGLPIQGFGVAPAANLEPGAGVPFQLYSVPGNDVELHLYVINRYEGEDLASFNINVTVMVDHQPVEVVYSRMSPDRERRLSVKVTFGINFRAESDFEIIDVRIPGRVFDERRMYDIGINLQSNTIRRASAGKSKRFALYNGGYSRPDRPCAEPRLDDALTEIEQQAPGRISDAMGFLFFEGITHRDELREEIKVEPGETLTLYLSVLRVALMEKGPTPTVLQPTLNGEPYGEPWWITQGGDTDTIWQYVDARKSFEVTFPEEPGTYEVQVLSWEDPFEIARDIDGNRIEGVSDGGGLNENSNALRFRVPEPE